MICVLVSPPAASVTKQSSQVITVVHSCNAAAQSKKRAHVMTDVQRPKIGFCDVPANRSGIGGARTAHRLTKTAGPTSPHKTL